MREPAHVPRRAVTTSTCPSSKPADSTRGPAERSPSPSPSPGHGPQESPEVEKKASTLQTCVHPVTHFPMRGGGRRLHALLGLQFLFQSSNSPSKSQLNDNTAHLSLCMLSLKNPKQEDTQKALASASTAARGQPQECGSPDRVNKPPGQAP